MPEWKIPSFPRPEGLFELTVRENEGERTVALHQKGEGYDWIFTEHEFRMFAHMVKAADLMLWDLRQPTLDEPEDAA